MSVSATMVFHSAQALADFAAELSLFARPGMVILLQGELGAGKSTLARAFIQALAPAGLELDVPSPTFTLIQTYDETRVAVAHADLYRLTSDAELDELGIDDLLDSHVLLAEWPERIIGRSWPDLLLVELAGTGATRTASVIARGAWAQAMQRNGSIAKFLAGAGWQDAKRTFLEGDASFRRYETLTDGGRDAILMDMPERPDGPAVRDGKPYSAIAHLAEDIRAVVAINAELVARGYSAPKTEAFDLDEGLAVIEDLGDQVYGRMMLAGADMRQPMAAAVAVLADMAGSEWPTNVNIDGHQTYQVPRYDIAAQLIEIDLLPSWFWPHVLGDEIPASRRTEFEAIWTGLLPHTQPDRPVWALRDYHSPNLLWLPDRQGIRRVGLIDTQDCLMGHPAYDLASMLQDARVDIPFAMADELFEIYCGLRRAQGAFDRQAFEIAYALLGAQRATKILGIFARLSKRDGKHGYLRHMPRVSRYLERNLQQQALAPLKTWFDIHLPASLRESQA